MKLQTKGSSTNPSGLSTSYKKSGFKPDFGFDLNALLARNENDQHQSELDRALENQLMIYDFLDNDVDKKIKLTLSRQKTLIKGRYISMLNHLEKTKKNLVNFKQKIAQWEKELSENEYVKNLTEELSNYQKYSAILRRDFEEIDRRIKAEEAKVDGLITKMNKRKTALTEINHENIVWASQISNLKGILAGLNKGRQVLPLSDSKRATSSGRGEYQRNKLNSEPNESATISAGFFKSKALRTSIEKLNGYLTKEKTASDKTSYNLQQQASDSQKLNQDGKDFEIENQQIHIDNEKESGVVPYHPVTQSVKVDYKKTDEVALKKRELAEIENQNHMLKKEFLARTDKFWDTKKLFEQGFHLENKFLMKNQEIGKDNGLAGSLLFEMKKQQGLEKMVNDFKQKGEGKVSSNQDREARILIHGALRRLFDKKIKEKLTETNSEAFWIPWDVFQTFTPQQIIGILALKPEGIERLKMSWTQKEKPLNKILADYKLRITK